MSDGIRSCCAFEDGSAAPASVGLMLSAAFEAVAGVSSACEVEIRLENRTIDAAIIETTQRLTRPVMAWSGMFTFLAPAAEHLHHTQIAQNETGVLSATAASSPV